MIRRSIAAVVLGSFMVAYAWPAHAQQAAPPDDSKRSMFWFAVGAALGTAIGFTIGRAFPNRFYVRVAEGLTSATLDEGIRVAPRMFTPFELTQACRDAARVARLEVAPNPLELRADARYALNTLSVVAINGADVAVPGVPIVVEAESLRPAVVQLRSDDPDLNAGRLHILRDGAFRVRVRTICGTPHAEALIRALVGVNAAPGVPVPVPRNR